MIEKGGKAMNRKVMKFISILLMVLMVVTMLSTAVFATSEDKAGDSWSNIDINQFNRCVR